MNKKTLILGSTFAAFAVLGAVVLFAQPVLAACDPSGGLQGGISCAGGGSGFAKGSLQDNIKTVVNALLLAIGIISVIMVIIGGIRYALSGGNESAVSGAKDTILYAIVGLVIAILAFAIVNFVTRLFGV